MSGGELYLSAGTVRNYLARVVANTGARTRLEAIRIAEHSGWILTGWTGRRR
jgi:two-component system, NarL family, response regulator DesR